MRKVLPASSREFSKNENDSRFWNGPVQWATFALRDQPVAVLGRAHSLSPKNMLLHPPIQVGAHADRVLAHALQNFSMNSD